MSYDQLRQYIDAAERGELEWRTPENWWMPISNAYQICNHIIHGRALRITPKPVYRAWETVDEVPVGAWVRQKSRPTILYQLGQNKPNEDWCGMARVGVTDVAYTPLTLHKLFMDYELTTDLKTFTPCGVEVKG